jgi:nitrite reductase (NADH) large subunit
MASLRLAGVFGFRTLDDCRRISNYAKKSTRAIVIGGGLLGLEAARGLQNFGLDVHIVHLADYLMNQQLDSEAGAILRTTIEKMGMHIHLLTNTAQIYGTDAVTCVGFAGGGTLDCDMIVISAGIKPNVELATQCGLTVERAIVVDNRLRAADDPNIYAVGECVQHRGRCYGLVAPLWEQAKVLADHITEHDRESKYFGSKIRDETQGYEDRAGVDGHHRAG